MQKNHYAPKTASFLYAKYIDFLGEMGPGHWIHPDIFEFFKTHNTTVHDIQASNSPNLAKPPHTHSL